MRTDTGSNPNPYGHFDDAAREYVITRPDTPLPWINYMGNRDYLGIISNTAGGYSFYRDARLRRITRYRYNNVPLDSNGRYIYIKDGDGIWNPGWKPSATRLDFYECRHGPGYTRITGSRNGMKVSVRYFVPPGENAEIWDLRIANESSVTKRISLWGMLEWCFWDAMDDMSNFQRNFSIGEVEHEENVIYHVTEYRERRNHFAYFAVFGAETVGFDTSRDSFVGVHGSLGAPEAVLEGCCRDSLGTGWARVGVHQVDIELAPGESKRLHFLLGYAENPENLKFEKYGIVNKSPYLETAAKFADSESVETAFTGLEAYWNERLSIFRADTGDELFSRMVNTWNQYQCMVTLNLSRSASLYESGIGRGMGFRDSNQDLLGVVHMEPERARERVLELAATQLSDGSCHHQFQPLTGKGNAMMGSGFNDDPLWLPLSTYAYLAETGDFSILEERTGFSDLDNRDGATLLDHLEKSVSYTLERLGPHGLPLIGHADWNDCLNLNCFSREPGESFQLAGDVDGPEAEVAESLMIAGLFCTVCGKIAEIYRFTGSVKDAERMLSYRKKMLECIEIHGWDGEWFLRAYDASGKKVGSKENDEGKIFIESQGWCILGGAGFEGDRALKALDSVREHLSTPNGIVLQQPAYSQYHPELGEISSYPPGYKENAGIFTHNNTWIQIAETLLGRGDRAFEYYMKICPVAKELQIDSYRCEPYCYSQMTAGPDSENFGEAKNSWLSGTAAWSFVLAAQHILGIRPELDGILIDPCVPREWKSFKVSRRYRGALYNINVENPDGVSKGVAQLSVEGEPLDGAKIPCAAPGKTVEVKVLMGQA